MASPEWVIVGRIRKVHGLQGELVVEPITDRPDEVFSSGRRVFAGTAAGDVARDRRELVVLHSTPFKGGFIVAFDGIADRDEAEKWRGRFVLLPGSELPPLDEGEVYVHDLHGLRVELPTGDVIGTVDATYELPQGLALDVRLASGKGTVLIPWRDEVVRTVDLAGGRLVVEPPEGLLD